MQFTANLNFHNRRCFTCTQLLLSVKPMKSAFLEASWTSWTGRPIDSSFSMMALRTRFARRLEVATTATLST